MHFEVEHKHKFSIYFHLMSTDRFNISITSYQATNILTILQSSARGTQACINAGSTINGIIADLDTTIMFASAGTLTAEPGETFSNYRWNDECFSYF